MLRRILKIVTYGSGVLFFFACLALVLIQFAPSWFLQGIGFTAQGSTDDFWIGLRRDDAPQTVSELVLGTQVLTLAPMATLTVSTQTPLHTQSISSLITETPTSNPTNASSLTPILGVTPTLTPSPTLTSSPTPLFPQSVAGILNDDVIEDAGNYRVLFSSSAIPDETQVVAPNLPIVNFRTENSFANYFETGTDIQGVSLVILEYREDVFQDACDYWDYICSTPTYELQGVDFRAGGVIIDVKVKVGSAWSQEVGIAVAQDNDSTTFSLVGLVLDDEVYAVPEDGRLADAIRLLVQKANDTLLQAQITIDDKLYRLDAIQINNEALVVILR